MTDPLFDPRFPDRPQHPDFWRLADCALKLDGQASEGGIDPFIISAQYVDLDSVLYMSRQRAGMALSYAPAGAQPLTIVEGAILSSIIHGILFEKEGGHRDAAS